MAAASIVWLRRHERSGLGTNRAAERASERAGGQPAGLVWSRSVQASVAVIDGPRYERQASLMTSCSRAATAARILCAIAEGYHREEEDGKQERVKSGRGVHEGIAIKNDGAP